MCFVLIGADRRFVGESVDHLHGERRGDAITLEEQSEFRAHHHHTRHNVHGGVSR